MSDWGMGVVIFLLLAAWVLAKKLLPIAVAVFIVYMIALLIIDFFD